MTSARRRLLLPTLISSVASFASTARADPPTEQRWYGSQTLVVDAAGLAGSQSRE